MTKPDKDSLRPFTNALRKNFGHKTPYGQEENPGQMESALVYISETMDHVTIIRHEPMAGPMDKPARLQWSWNSEATERIFISDKTGFLAKDVEEITISQYEITVWLTAFRFRFMD